MHYTCFSCHLKIHNIVVWLVLMVYMWKVTGLSLRLKVSYHVRDVIWFFSVPEGILWDCTLK